MNFEYFYYSKSTDTMTKIPRDTSFDSTLALVNDGYKFIDNRCKRLQSDIFQTRLLFQKTICMKGEQAAKTFYDTELFKREGVTPNLIKATLFGKGSAGPGWCSSRPSKTDVYVINE